jgi:hypothetical protein
MVLYEVCNFFVRGSLFGVRDLCKLVEVGLNGGFEGLGDLALQFVPQSLLYLNKVLPLVSLIGLNVPKFLLQSRLLFLSSLLVLHSVHIEFFGIFDQDFRCFLGSPDFFYNWVENSLDNFRD